MTEKTLKHELYKHGSYLISLKESGSNFVNIDDEIKKLEELFQMASKKDHQPDLNIKNNNNNPTPWSQIMTDHQQTFAVGEYVADEDFIYHILADRGETNRLVNSFELSTGLFHRNIVWTYKGLRKPKPATAEQIATFKRAEHFASKGRKLDEFRVGDKVDIYDSYKFIIESSYDIELSKTKEGKLIQTAEELQEVGE